jgi:streptomycin 6-kinase
MQIPEYFIKKIKQAFGEEGEKWLEELPQTFLKCVKRWDLADFILSNDLSHNLIVFATSPDYGAVALKIGVPHADLFTEMEALQLYGGRHICVCYDLDKELGALLLERFVPGVNLTNEKGTTKRVKIASDVIANLAIQAKDNHELPAYSDWLDKAFSRARLENKVGQKMLSFIDLAERMYGEIEASDRPKFLLHGDLHHYNILQDQNEEWQAIDPKGVIGQACMDTARFMENQLDMVQYEDKKMCLDEMIDVFSSKFNEPKHIIATCLFIDYVLSTCWHFEDSILDENDQLDAIDRCEFVLKNYSGAELWRIFSKQ